MDEAIKYLEKTEGNILVTTGSKELESYTRLTDYESRVYARVLSIGQVAVNCEELGFSGRHLICMQGPFSTEMNRAMLKEYDIAYMRIPAEMSGCTRSRCENGCDRKAGRRRGNEF